MFRRKQKRNSHVSFAKKLTFEQLEDKRVLAAILWVNELDVNGNFNPQNQFQDTFGENAPAARAVVHRAMRDWEAVIDNFNYIDSSRNNTFRLNLAS